MLITKLWFPKKILSYHELRIVHIIVKRNNTGFTILQELSLCLPLPKNLVSYLTKLRISAHQLYVETGRYCNPSIPRENKFCFHCKNIVEDGNHFLLDCPLYKHVRKMYSKLLDTNILTCLLNPHSLVSTKQTCQYIRDCFDTCSK